MRPTQVVGFAGLVSGGWLLADTGAAHARSIHQPHLPSSADLVAAELGGTITESRLAHEVEQRLRPLAIRECVARCWPPALLRARCEWLMEGLVSPRSFSTDQSFRR
jgi:hypothetical protein